ncbi:Enhancer of mRNA-decapping protein 4 [Danaus plexippus plexippus]|uniref:Enhancer of mRNA-decapping protein 4 n=1 Tax=Danaus plexippus plexippus TaxID=278856 RepID=A0A212EGT8_DANPL|nr:Enhancer of mRNA-decapping protein 4 [Danaus plexippus plexippus]
MQVSSPASILFPVPSVHDHPIGAERGVVTADSDFVECNGRFCNYGEGDLQSDSSLEICEIFANKSYGSLEDHLDSGFIHLDPSETSRSDSLLALELKVVKLSEILQEQNQLLQDLKDEISFLKSCSVNNSDQKTEMSESSNSAVGDTKIVLDTDDLSRAQSMETDLRNIITEYMKSDDLKDHLAATVVERLKEVMRQCLSEAFRQVYLPFLERSQRRLLAHVSRTLHSAFHELEKKSYFLYKSVHKSTRSLKYAIEKHLMALENDRPTTVLQFMQNNLDSILKTEVSEWIKSLLSPQLPPLSHDENNYEEDPLTTSTSPPQPTDPELSIIDQLMKSARINKQIENGEINEAFEEALSSADLSLVMTACRAAHPQRVFDPCRLKQPVLLALIQQLATDMVHDTQLKCRYLEDALIKLDVSDKVTRAHLPLIVGEIRKHLSRFLRYYPSHVAGRRITLIVMVADNLLNNAK